MHRTRDQCSTQHFLRLRTQQEYHKQDQVLALWLSKINSRKAVFLQILVNYSLRTGQETMKVTSQLLPHTKAICNLAPLQITEETLWGDEMITNITSLPSMQSVIQTWSFQEALSRATCTFVGTSTRRRRRYIQRIAKLDNFLERQAKRRMRWVRTISSHGWRIAWHGTTLTPIRQSNVETASSSVTWQENVPMNVAGQIAFSVEVTSTTALTVTLSCASNVTRLVIRQTSAQRQTLWNASSAARSVISRLDALRSGSTQP